MTITAILRTRWFGREADEEYLFHIICRGPYDFIILEEKNTDKRYRVEYDNQYRKIEDTVREILEELRTREFDNHKDALADTMINWTFYTPIIGDICALIEHRVEKIELLGNPDKYPGNVTFHNVSADNSATISLAMPIEAEYQYIRNHISQAGS
jgi:hypothetical protein